MQIRTPLWAMVISVSLFLAGGIQAQSSDAVQALMQAKRQLAQAVTQWDAPRILEARALFERLTTDKDLAPLAHYYVGYADYRLSIYWSQQHRSKAVEYLEDAISHLEEAMKLDASFAEAAALLSSCYGQKIGYEPRLAMALGPKSAQMMAAAKNLQPGNPRVVLLEAISTYFTPANFGGSKEKALAGFRKAAELFASWQPADSLQPDWGREEVYAWIGLAHLDRDEPILAKRAFEKALAINPEYAWVKENLMPRVVERKGN